MLVGKEVLLPEQTVSRVWPVNVTGPDKSLFQHEISRTFGASFFKRYTRVFVSKDEKVLSDFWPIFDVRCTKKRLLLTYFDLIKGGSRYDSGFLVSDQASHNFFHWHCDVLPKLELLDKEKIRGDILIPFNFCKGFYEETLKLYPDLNFRYCDKRFFVQEATYVENTAPTGNYRPEIINDVRKRLAGLDVSVSDEPKKIYISRKRAKYRRVVEEELYEDGLRRLGFTILYMEDLDYKEQIRYMRSADVLLSLHGAGLTHCLFMKENSKVIEIRAEGDALNNCYFSLSSDLGHHYYYILAKPTENHKTTQLTDFVLPADFLDKVSDIVKT